MEKSKGRLSSSDKWRNNEVIPRFSINCTTKLGSPSVRAELIILMDQDQTPAFSALEILQHVKSLSFQFCTAQTLSWPE